MLINRESQKRCKQAIPSISILVAQLGAYLTTSTLEGFRVSDHAVEKEKLRRILPATGSRPRSFFCKCRK